ncbi:MAG: geranylgeranyl reductase family protein [Myxococcota bacterium]
MSQPEPLYDVAIVGAGPAGATAAATLAEAGKRVALLDKATFPRDKRCGDAWCQPALEILAELGVLPELEAQGAVQWVRSGGLVSPSGRSFVSPDEGAREGAPPVAAIQRKVADEAIVRAAERRGAELHEGAAVVSATLAGGEWTVRCKDKRRFRARMLVAADGATSRLARSLGVVTTPANGVASRQYIKGGTHHFTSDGVLLYPDYVLPGYVAFFRHPNDDIDLGCYALPGGRVPASGLKELIRTKVAADPFVREVLGDGAEPLERPGMAPLRLGGERRSYGERLLVVGDAAGHTDPLTGEGIHTAMVAARHAARVVNTAFVTSDFSPGALAAYQRAWMRSFGRDFPISAAAARAIDRFPALLDTAVLAAQRHGVDFMDGFGAAMTGVASKATFLAPKMALPLAAALLRLGLGRGRRAYAEGPRGDARAPAYRHSFMRHALAARA